MSIAEDYERIAAEQSDMHGHMGFLRHCAEKYDAPRIIELGTRTGRSTAAFLAGLGGGHLWSVDVRDPQPPADGWRGLDCWSFLRADDISDLAYRWLPARADILFIDTSHEYEHTCVELAMYAPRVAMGGLILMHDTEYPEINGVRPSAHESEVGRALDWWCPRHPRYGGIWENRTGSYGMGVMRVI